MTDHDHSLCVLSDAANEFCLITRKPGPCIGQKRGMYQAAAQADLPTPGKTGRIVAAPVRNLPAEAARQRTVDQGIAQERAAQLLQHTGGLKGKQVQTATAAQQVARKNVTRAVGEDNAYERRLGQEQRQHDSSVKQDANATKQAAAHQAAAEKRAAGVQVRAGKKAAAAAKKAAGTAAKNAPKNPASVAQWLQYGVDGADTVAFWLEEFGDAEPVETVSLEGADMATVFALYGLETPAPYLYGMVASGHETCWISQFCRNPLHPGPCKGWKHMLHSVSPGAYHAIERNRVQKLNERRLAKIADLQKAGKPVPPRLLKPIDYKTPGVGGPRGLPPNPAHWTPPTKAQARAVLPPTSKQIGVKIAARHDPKLKRFLDKKDYYFAKDPIADPDNLQQGHVVPLGNGGQSGHGVAQIAGPVVKHHGEDHMLLREPGKAPYLWPTKTIKKDLGDLNDRMKGQVPGQQKLPIGTPAGPNMPAAPVGAPPSGMTPRLQHAADASKTLTDSAAALGTTLSDTTKKAVTAHIHDALGKLKPGEKLSDERKVKATIDGMVKRAGEAADAAGKPLTTQQLDDMRGNIAQHVDAGVPDVPILVTSAANHIGINAPAAPSTPALSTVQQLAKDATGNPRMGLNAKMNAWDAMTKAEYDGLPDNLKTTITGLLKHAANAAPTSLLGQKADRIHTKLTGAGVPAVAAAKPPAHTTSPVVRAHLDNQGMMISKRLDRLPAAAKANPPHDATNLAWGKLDNGIVTDSNGHVIGKLDGTTAPSGAGWVRVETTLDSRVKGQKYTVSVWKPADQGAPKIGPSSAPGGHSTPSGGVSAPSGGVAVKTRPAPTPSAPLPAGTAPHVQHAVATAHRSAPGAGVAKKQIDAYQPLTKADFDTLPDATKTQIVTDLTAAHAKFMDPKKKAAAQDLIDRFGGKGDGLAPKKAIPPAAPSSTPKATAPGGVNVANRADAYRVLRTPQTTSASVKLPIFQKLTKDDYDSMPPAMQDALKASLDEADRAGMHKAGVDAVRATLGLPAAPPAAHPGAYNPAQRQAAQLAGPQVDTSTDKAFLNAVRDLSRHEYQQMTDADKKAVMDRLTGIGGLPLNQEAASARAHASRLGIAAAAPSMGGTPTTTPQPVRDAQVLLNSPAWHNTSPARKLDLLKDLKADHFGKLTPAEQDKIKTAVDAVDKLGSHTNAVAEVRKRLGLTTPARGGQLRQDLQDVLDDNSLTPSEKITALPWNLDANRFLTDLTDDQRKHVLDLLQHVADSQAYTNEQKSDAALMHSRLTGKFLRTLPQTGASQGPIAALNSESWNDPQIYTPDTKAKALGKLDKRLYDALNHKQKDRADAALKELETAGHPDVAAIRSNLGLAPAGTGHPVLDKALESGDPHEIIGAYSRVLNGSRTAAESKALDDFRQRVENDPKHPDWLRTAMYADRAGHGNAAAQTAGEPPSPQGKWFTTYSRLGDLASVSDADKAKLPDYVQRSIDDRLSMGVRDLLNVGSKTNTLQAIFGDKLDKLDRYDKLDPQAKRAVDSALRAVRDAAALDPKKQSEWQRAIDKIDKTAFHPHQQAAIDAVHGYGTPYDRINAYETLGKAHNDTLPAAHRGAIAMDLLNLSATAQGGATRRYARHAMAKLAGIMPGYANPHAQDAALAAGIDKPDVSEAGRADRYMKLTLMSFGPMHANDKIEITKDMDALAASPNLPLADRFDLQEKRDFLTHAMRPTSVEYAIDSARPSGTFLPEQTRIANYGALSQGDHAALPRVYRDAIEADLHKLSVGHPNAFNLLMQKFNPGWTPPQVAPQPVTPVMSNTPGVVKDALDALYGLHPKSQHVSHQLKTYGALRTAQFQTLQSHEQQTLLADLSYIATTSKGANATKAQKIIDRFTPAGTPAGQIPSQAIIPPVTAVTGQVRDPNPAGTAGLLKQATDKGQSGDGWTNAGGKRVWGQYGAAGVMLRHVDSNGVERYLMIQRGKAISDPGKWQFPGGAIDSKETPHQGAARETIEELGFNANALEHARVHGHHESAIPNSTWKYTSIVATVDHQLQADLSKPHARAETEAAEWMTAAEIRALDSRGKLLAPLAGGQLEKNVMALFPNAAHQPAGAARPGAVTKKPARLTGTPMAPKPVKAHKPSKGRDLLATPAAKDQLRQDVKTARRAYAGKAGDDRLAAIGAMQGYDDTPTVLSKSEVDRLLKTGDYIEAWRGVQGGYRSGGKSAAQINEEMRSGPAWYGKGVFGNGYYLATNERVARQYSDHTKNSVMRILIPKEAATKMHQDVVRGAHANSSARSKAKGGGYEDGTLWDEGRYAAAIGLDGIEIDPFARSPRGGGSGHVASRGKHAYNWLNRSVLIIQEADK